MTRRNFFKGRNRLFFIILFKSSVCTYIFLLFNLVLQVFLLQSFVPHFLPFSQIYLSQFWQSCKTSSVSAASSFALIDSSPRPDSSSVIEGVVFFLGLFVFYLLYYYNIYTHSLSSFRMISGNSRNSWQCISSY